MYALFLRWYELLFCIRLQLVIFSILVKYKLDLPSPEVSPPVNLSMVPRHTKSLTVFIYCLSARYTKQEELRLSPSHARTHTLQWTEVG